MSGNLLGNMWFSMGLADDDFQKKLKEDLGLARTVNKEMTEVLSKISASSGDYSKLALQEQRMANAANLRAQAAERESRAKLISSKADITNSRYTEAAEKAALAAQKKATEEERTHKAILQSAIAQERLNSLQTKSESSHKNVQAVISSTNGKLTATASIMKEIGSYAGGFFSIFAAGQLISSLVTIRGEFDMQLISLKAILQSGEKATEIFNQIKGLAVISPFKFLDLTTYAKQLSAYQIPTGELFDTTKRLADLSAGLGVDMNRIILAYGQVKSASVLRGQELRQFTEAGIPMVQALADKFSLLEKRVVSTGEVFSKISNREVSFDMVKDVIDDLTNEGGKFYMMQEKQSESLKGKISNLADSYDILMNSLGESNDGALKGTVDLMTLLMNNADKLIAAIYSLVGVYGMYRASVALSNLGIGKETSSVLESLMADKKKEASKLMIASSYRQLTAEENLSLISSKKLVASDLFRLASEGKLNKEMLLRAVAVGKVSEADAILMKTQLGLSNSEINYAVNYSRRSGLYISQNGVVARSFSTIGNAFSKIGIDVSKTGLNVDNFNRKISTLRLGVNTFASGVGSAISSILSPANLVMMAITAIGYSIFEWSQERKELEKRSQETGDSIKQSYEELRQFVASNPIKVVIDSGDGDQIKKMIDKYEEQINQSSPLSLSVIAQAGKIDGDKERLEYLSQYTDKLGQALIIAGKFSGIMEQANADTGRSSWYDLFDDSMLENLKDYSSEMGNFRSELNKIKVADVLSELQGKKQYASQYENIKKLADEGKSIRDIYKDLDGSVVKLDIFSGARSASFDMRVAKKTVEEDINEFYQYVQKTIDSEHIDIKSDVGKNVIAKLKEQMLSQSGLDDNSKEFFNIAFDSKMFGSSDAIITAIGKTMQDMNNTIVKETARTGVWGESIDNLYKQAVTEVYAKYPEYKAAIDKTIGKGITIELKTFFKTSKPLEDWQQELDNLTKHKYTADIKASSNVTEVLEMFQKEYDAFKKKMDEQKPTLLRVGFNFQSNTLPSPINDPILQHMSGEYSAEKTDADTLKNVLEKYYHNTKEKKPKKEKDTFTEGLKQQVELIKSAQDEYEKLLKIMSPDKAKTTILSTKGFENVNPKYLTQYGDETMYTDYLKKLGKRNTDTAKSVRVTWNKELGKIEIDKISDSVQKQLDIISKDLKFGEENYNLYDKIFSYTGNAKSSASIAFGGAGKSFEDYISFAKSKLTEEANLIGEKSNTFEKILSLTPEQRSKLNEDVIKLFDEIQSTIKTKKTSVAENVSKAIYDAMSISDKIGVKGNLRDKELNDYMSNSDGAKEGDAGYNAILEKWNNEITELRASLFEMSPEFKAIFVDITGQSINQIEQLRQKAIALLELIDKTKTAKVVDGEIKGYSFKNNKGEDSYITKEDYDKTHEKVEKLGKKSSQVQISFERMWDWISGKKQSDKSKLTFKDIAGDLSTLASEASGLANQFGSFFSALGNDSAAAGAELAGNLLSSVSSIAQGISTGNPFAIVGGIVSGITSIFQAHDKALDAYIEKSKAKVKQLENVYDQISSQIERSLGGASTIESTAQIDTARQKVKDLKSEIDKYTGTLKNVEAGTFSYWVIQSKLNKAKSDYAKYQAEVDAFDTGGAYGLQRQLLQEQITQLEAQRQAEIDKKKTNQSTVDDYTSQIEELTEKIRYLAEDTMSELLSVDLKDWASQIGDALVDAFASGEDAVSAFDKTVGSIMKSVVKKMASLYILEPMFEKLRVYLFGEDGTSGVYGKDFTLSADELSGMMTYIDAIKDTGIPAVENLFSSINDALGGIMSDSSSSSLSASISSITEDQADLLASYVNAMRSDLSDIRAMQELYYGLSEDGDGNKGSYIATISVAVEKIEANTLRSANNTDYIYSLLVKLTTQGNPTKLNIR